MKKRLIFIAGALVLAASLVGLCVSKSSSSNDIESRVLFLEGLLANNMKKVKDAIAQNDTWINDTSESLTPLMEAVYWGRPLAVILLVANGADVNVTTTIAFGMTPLHMAYAAGEDVIAEILEQKGADTEIRDGFGSMPVYYKVGTAAVRKAEWAKNKKELIKACKIA